MKVKIIGVIALSVLCVACAGVEKRNQSELIGHEKQDGRLEISAEINKYLSSDYFGMIELVFVNRKNTWLRIQNIDIEIDDKELEKSIKLTTGIELQNWHKAMKKKIAIGRYNQSIISSSLILAGVVAGSSGRSDSNHAAGIGLAAVGLSSYTLSELANVKNDVEQVGLFPSGHLLSNPDIIPPALFLEKWLLIDTSEVKKPELLKSFNMKITYSDNISETYHVVLLYSDEDIKKYKWQRTMYDEMKSKPPL